MPTYGNKTLNTKVYTPIGVKPDGITQWQNRDSDSPQGYSLLTLQVRSPSPGSKNYRATSKLLVPVVQEEDSACGCAGAFLRQIACEVTFTIDSTSTAAEREDAYERFKAWVNDATNFEAAFQDLLPTYG